MKPDLFISRRGYVLNAYSKIRYRARENENPHQTDVFTETADPNLILEYPF